MDLTFTTIGNFLLLLKYLYLAKVAHRAKVDADLEIRWGGGEGRGGGGGRSSYAISEEEIDFGNQKTEIKQSPRVWLNIK